MVSSGCRMRVALRALGLPVLATAGLGLVGCEAELRLEGVDTTLSQPVRRTDQFLSIERAGDGSLVAFADHGVLIEAASGADPIAWTRVELPEPAPNFISSATCPDGAVYGLSFENELWSRTAGAWNSAPVSSQEQLQALTCNEAGDLWVSGAFGTLVRSSDGGASWDDFSLYEDFTLTGITFADDQTGYAVGEFGTLVKTSDGGESWEMMDPITDDFYPLSVHFNGQDEGWVSGVLGLILYTNDGGMSWETQDTATQASIYGFVTAEANTYAFGDLGALLRYDAESAAWVDQPSPDIPVHYASAAALDGRLLLVGGWGVVMEVAVTASTASAANDVVAHVDAGMETHEESAEEAL